MHPARTAPNPLPMIETDPAIAAKDEEIDKLVAKFQKAKLIKSKRNQLPRLRDKIVRLRRELHQMLMARVVKPEFIDD